MKHLLFIILIIFISCKSETPTEFSQEALEDKVFTLNNEEITLEDVLAKYKGKTILMDVWASWCGDCIKGLPKVSELQREYKDITYLFISIDKSTEDWKNGIEKYKIKGEHYLLPSGRDGDFDLFMNLDWIPRYVVIDSEGKIALFRAVEADDERILKALNVAL